MNDSSSRAFVNDPVASGIPIREQNSVANNSEEEQATSITPSATSNSGDEGSDKAMDSINNNGIITSNGNGNGNAAQQHPDSSNSHQQHMGETASPQSEFNDPPSFGSMNASAVDQRKPESAPQHEFNGSAPAQLSGNHHHSSSNNMSAGEADERQAIIDMEIQETSNTHTSSNNMSAGEADERQAIVDLEIQDSSSSGSDELEIIDQDVDDVSAKFGSEGLTLGGVRVRVQEQQQQQPDLSSNEATQPSSYAPVNAVDPIPVDVAHESASQQQAEPAAAQASAAAASSADAEVIELLDDDEADDGADSDNTDDLITKALTSNMNRAKRQKMSGDDNGKQAAPLSYQDPNTTAQQPYQPPSESRWTQDTSSRRHGTHAPIQPGQSLNLPSNAKTDSAARAAQAMQQAYEAPITHRPIGIQHQRLPMPPQPSLTPKDFQSRFKYDEPQYIPYPHGFVPTWNELVPAKQKPPPQQQYQHRSNERKYFQLSLLNVNDFTITGLPISFDGPPTSISGMRVPIRQVSREHGKAIYERDKEGGPGKWRIPLGAYQAFFTYLRSDPNCRVEGISSIQLKVASLERARQEKGYPSVEKLIEAGVPNGLARTLAPFQRGGVDFVLEKKGRALIADGTYVLVD
jgi:hypothetical protein